MNRTSKVIALVILVASCTAEEPGSTADPSEDQLVRPDYIDEIFRRVGTNEFSYPISHDDWIHIQRLPAAGREDRHAEVADWGFVAEHCGPANEGDGDVMSTIAALAGDTRIVIINEAHDRPHHREFTKRVAARIAPLGYTHFAAEAFEPDTLVNDESP
ncbi:MAG: hypothetical protein OXB98_02220, partial [Bryobacterales bacterium]|nr:hypothetical protein [Bryobacterales bacterium]